MSNEKNSKLSFDLTDDQMRSLRPLIEATGNVKITGEITADNKLNVSFIACNAAFLACNAAFIACNAPFKVSAKQEEKE